MRFLLLFFLFLSTTVYSQSTKSSLRPFVKKGTYLLGGSINGSFRSYSRAISTESGQNKGTIADIKGDIRVGYFLLKYLTIGAQASANHFSYQNESLGSGRHSTYFLYGPFVRGYVKNGFFGETGVSYGSENVNENTGSQLLEGKLAMGYTYFLNNKVAIEPILSFRYLQNKHTSVIGVTRQTEIGPSFGIAVQAFLYRGKMGVNTELRRSKY